MNEKGPVEVVENALCFVCNKNNLTCSKYSTCDTYTKEFDVISESCKCGFRNFYLDFKEGGGPKRYVLLVTKDELNSRVVKSKEGVIRIPQLDISVDSFPNSQSFVSNVEGVLRRILQQLKILERDVSLSEVQKQKLRSALEKLGDVIRGRGALELVLDCRSGNCAIISENVKVEEIS